MIQHPSPDDIPTGRLARADGWPLVVLLLLYLLPGSLQRGPWKNEDAIYFGVVWRALTDGDWLHFHLAAATLPEAPLYFWASGIGANFLQAVLPAPAAIRFATIVFVAITFLATYLIARRWFDRPWAGLAPLTLAGCLGLLIASHDVQPMTATLAALSILLYGLSLVRATAHFPAAPWLLAATVIGLGFAGVLLASGFRLLPAVVATVAVGFIHGEKRRYARTLFSGLLIGSLPFVAWWLALQARSPALAHDWLSHQLHLVDLHADSTRYFWINLKTLSWWAWPAWPLAVYAIWIHRRRLHSPALLGPLVMVVSLLLALSLASESRQVWLATLLPPLAVLAVPALMAMRRGVEGLLDWFGRAVFGLLLLVIMLGWTALVFGWPVRWAAKAARLAPGFVATIDPLAVAMTLLVAGGWIWTIVRSRRSPRKSLFSWTGGLIVCWVAIVALWLPWLDHQRSYRTVAGSVGAAMGSASACLRVKGVSEAQHAMLDYYLTPVLSGSPDCAWWLVRTGSEEHEPGNITGWTRVWDGARPGDKSERYYLLRRD